MNRTISVADSQESDTWNCYIKDIRLDNNRILFLSYQLFKEEYLNMNQGKDDLVMLKTVDLKPVQSPETGC